MRAAAFRFRYLKNIMGLWMNQSVRREINGVDYVEGKTARKAMLDHKVGFDELCDLCREAEPFEACCQFYPGRGTITFLGITQDGNSFKFVAAEGETWMARFHLWRHQHAHEVLGWCPASPRLPRRPARS